MEMILLLMVLFVGGFFLIRALRASEQSSYVERPDMFSSNGVSVDYKTGDINIKGYRSHVSKLSSVRWESVANRSGWVTRYNSTAYIMLEDMNRPLHRFSMVGEHTAQQFLERFKVAVRKAGGPTFS